MYIVSIKKGTAPREYNIVDELFGDVDINNVSKFCRTQVATTDVITSTANDFNKHIKHLNKNYLNINNFLNTHNVEEMYTEFKIPKRTGGFRTIDAPNEELKKFMRQVSYNVINDFKLLPHDSAFAYVKRRSVIDAVKEHQKNKSRWFLKIDLKDFFGSCNPTFIKEQLLKLYPFAMRGPGTNDFIDALVKLSCLNNKLPQGTPISPWLTNLVMVEYDYKITKMLNNLPEHGFKKQKYVYTRYADDILISAKEKFDYKTVIEFIKEILKDTPLTIKEEKTRFGSASGRNWNLGIMYNKDNELTIGHKKKRQIKDNIYYFIKFKDNFDLEQCQWLQGNISWLRSVEPEYTKGLLKYYKDKFDFDVWDTLLKQIKILNQ